MAFFKQKQVGKGRERVKIKIFVPSISFLTHNREFKKNSKKIQKKFKNTIMACFQAKRSWEKPRKSENKNYRSIISYLTRYRELKKNSKKIKITPL